MSQLQFAGQHADEKLLFAFRRHIIAMRKGFYGFLIIFALTCLIMAGLILAGNSDNAVLLWPLGGFLLGGLFLFYQWISWYFSVFIVTDQRIRQSTQNGLFGRSVIDLNLDNVQNISYNIPGFTGEIFGFGTIVLQTMVGDMVIHKVARCEKVYNALSAAIRLASQADQKHLGGQPQDEQFSDHIDLPKTRAEDADENDDIIDGEIEEYDEDE